MSESHPLVSQIRNRVLSHDSVATAVKKPYREHSKIFFIQNNPKSILELKALCQSHDVNESKINFAFELYMELCEVQKIWDVKHYFNEKLKLFYFTGKDRKNYEDYDVYVPMTTDEILSVEYLETLQENLSPSKKSLIIVFKDRDSSSTYYKFTQGLVRPESPTTAQKKKIEEKKYIQIQRYLTKWKNKLFDSAMKGEEPSE